MCGILGYSAQSPKRQLNSAIKLLQHRGPDGSGTFFANDKKVALGHTRLSILDLSYNGSQPMVSDCKRFALTYNGEIYNFLQLKRTLEEEGFSFKGNSDTEVVLKMCEKYFNSGNTLTDLLQHLDGMFAFALWDDKLKTLTLARDQFGVKPLYYAHQNDSFYFASEIKAIKKMGFDITAVNYKAMHRYMSFMWCPGKDVLAEGIYKVLPGQYVTFVKGKVIKKDWSNLDASSMVSDENMSLQEAIHGVKSNLKLAVEKQIISDVPVGAFLSGGLDSSAIVSIAREYVTDIPCFTIDIGKDRESGATQDLPFAKMAAKHLGLKLHQVSVNPKAIAQDIESMVYSLDEPIADPAALNVKYIAALARSNGVKVLLSGSGGDDIFSGYRRHKALQMEKFLRILPKEMIKTIASLFGTLDQRVGFVRKSLKFLENASIDGSQKLVNYFYWLNEETTKSVYSSDVKMKLRRVNAANPMLNFLNRFNGNISQLDRLLLLEQRFFLADHNLIYTDKMSMVEGVETRVPFLDKNLVKFSRTIPTKYKQNLWSEKWILKKTMEKSLPKKIIYRRKTGFGLPLRNWIRKDLRDLVNDHLNVTSLKRRGLFDPESVQKLISDNQKGVQDSSYSIFALLCIEIWCQKFID